MHGYGPAVNASLGLVALASEQRRPPRKRRHRRRRALTGAGGLLTLAVLVAALAYLG
jgi:hypothetical protein